MLKKRKEETGRRSPVTGAAACCRKRARKSKCPVRAWTNSIVDQFRRSSSCGDGAAGLRVANSSLPGREAAPSENNKMGKNVRYELKKVGERKFKLIKKKDVAVNG